MALARLIVSFTLSLDGILALAGSATAAPSTANIELAPLVDLQPNIRGDLAYTYFLPCGAIHKGLLISKSTNRTIGMMAVIERRNTSCMAMPRIQREVYKSTFKFGAIKRIIKLSPKRALGLRLKILRPELVAADPIKGVAHILYGQRCRKILGTILNQSDRSLTVGMLEAEANSNKVIPIAACQYEQKIETLDFIKIWRNLSRIDLLISSISRENHTL